MSFKKNSIFGTFRDPWLIPTSPTIHYDACQCNFATDFFSGIFRQNEQRRYLRVGFVL